MNHFRGDKKGFLTLELLLTITIFSMILIAFQDALVLSLRSQRKLEKITEQFQEKSMLIEMVQRDFSHLIPLKDGKQLYVLDDPNYLLLRFISQKSIAHPPRQSKSRMLLVEYLFNKTKGKDALLTRKIEEISGYNEYTLERELKDAFTTRYLLGGGLINYKLKGKEVQSWYEDSTTFHMEWKKSLKKSEIDFYRFYFYPFRVKKAGEDEIQ
ncbi:MAG: hypothetical protein KC646_06305 [Candidatus Cloacimonetes bacterium]|nr:hypothetical protein [Candidatus Cloacimonadota bacterium]